MTVKNGVWLLPGSPSQVSDEALRASEHPLAPRHLSLTRLYDRAVNDAILWARRHYGCRGVIRELRNIRRDLWRGGFPELYAGIVRRMNTNYAEDSHGHTLAI